jgi:hypothetical protein
MTGPSPWLDALSTLLRRSYLAQPSALAAVVNDAVRPLGVEVIVYLADREQLHLRALPEPGKPPGELLAIDGTLPGQAFRRVTELVSPQEPGRVWVPILDGTERLGVLAVSLPDRVPPPGVQESLRMLSVLIGHLLVAKMAYGDSLRRVRRSQPMSVGGEMLWRMLPPLTFATHDLIVAAMIEPCYDVGGDAYDYAVDNDLARITILDAVGHDLNAALTSCLTLSAIRAARVSGAGLPDAAAAADRALTNQFDDLRYATGILAELDLQLGQLRVVNAGHPQPVVLRSGRSVAVLDGGRRLPLGLIGPTDDPVEYSLEPGDLLLFYTDGITEARDEDGQLFGLERLIELAERQTADGHPAPEIARGISHAVMEYQNGQLHDDATVLLVEWGPGVGIRIVP